MVKTIRHAGITVTDMEKSLEFYRDLLGLKAVLDVEQEGEFCEKITAYPGRRRVVMLEAGDGNRIELFQFYHHPKAAPAKVETADVGCTHVCFSVDDVDAAYQKFSAEGIEFNCEPQVSPDGYAKVTYCHDPDGTIIELTQILDTGKDPYESRS